MTKPHRATPEQWETIERYADTSDPYACFLELRARIEALEVGQQPPQDKLDRLITLDRDDPANSLGAQGVERIATLCKVYNDAPDHCGPALRAAPIRSGPESPLVERVADAIAAQSTSAGIVNNRPARAAIREVAAWLKEQHGGDLLAATVLRREANR
jgi:hypothetical protein